MDEELQKQIAEAVSAAVSEAVAPLNEQIDQLKSEKEKRDQIEKEKRDQIESEKENQPSKLVQQWVSDKTTGKYEGKSLDGRQPERPKSSNNLSGKEI